jgi:signal transduction histidine kinase
VPSPRSERVAREIHDGLAQYLFAVSTHASMLEAGARSTRHCRS